MWYDNDWLMMLLWLVCVQQNKLKTKNLCRLRHCHLRLGTAMAWPAVIVDLQYSSSLFRRYTSIALVTSVLYSLLCRKKWKRTRRPLDVREKGRGKVRRRVIIHWNPKFRRMQGNERKLRISWPCHRKTTKSNKVLHQRHQSGTGFFLRMPSEATLRLKWSIPAHALVNKQHWHLSSGTDLATCSASSNPTK